MSIEKFNKIVPRQLTLKKILLILGIIVVVIFWLNSSDSEQKLNLENNYQAEAKRIVALCAEESHKPKCYDEVIPKVMDNGFTMEEAFEITSLVQDIDPSYQYCHVLGHELSARETAKDPSKWKDVVARSPLGICSNGGIHGAFQERFRVESFAGQSVDEIVPEIEGVCEPREGWAPTRMGQATCTHALGHLTMYITGGEIDPALELCDRLLDPDPRSSLRQLCYDGAFMQIYQPLEPEDFALIAGKEIKTQDESEIFCENFSGATKGSCISESWPLYRGLFSNPATINEVCSRADFDEWQYERCMNGVFYVAMAQSNLSVDWARDFCSEVDEALRGPCYGNSASRLIEVDDRNIEKALELCGDAVDETSKNACFDELLKYSAYTFSAGSPPFFQLCEGLPEPWSAKCLRQAPVEKL